MYNVNDIFEVEDKLIKFLCENNGELSLKKLEFGVDNDNVDEIVVTTPSGMYSIIFDFNRSVIQGSRL